MALTRRNQVRVEEEEVGGFGVANAQVSEEVEREGVIQRVVHRRGKHDEHDSGTEVVFLDGLRDRGDVLLVDDHRAAVPALPHLRRVFDEGETIGTRVKRERYDNLAGATIVTSKVEL